jgi:hypothetical protein
MSPTAHAERLSWQAGCIAAAVLLSGCKDPPAPPADLSVLDPPAVEPPAVSVAPSAASVEPPATSSRPRPSHHVDAPDLHHVDPAEIAAQARKIALDFEERAVLVSITVSEPMPGGTVDVAGSGGISYEYQWRYMDNTKGVVEGGLVATATTGIFQLREKKHAKLFVGARNDHPDPGPDPRCSLRDAWKAAVTAGLPAAAAVAVKYAAEPPGHAGQPYVWTFQAPGHDHVIDGATCAVHGAAPAPPAPSRPPSP